MAKKRIFVGYEYKDAFDSVCELIKGGCLNDLNYTLSGDKVISDGTYEYELSRKASAQSEKVKFTFEENGATWFKGLRGEIEENSDAIWTTFIENVGIEYHKRFSVVEYKQQAKTRQEKEEAYQECIKISEEFIRNFYPQFHGKTEVRQIDDEVINEDVYGVSMRIELSGGTGASLPILGKIYFNRDGRVMRPIKSSVAGNIDTNLKKVIPDDDKDETAVLPDDVIDVTLNAMDNLVNDSDLNFADFLCYSDESDKRAVEGLLAKLSHDAMEIECQRVDILYITHIKARSFTCDIYSAGMPLFRLTLGLNGSISISCLNCAEGEELVNRNEIEYKDPFGEVKTAYLKAEEENFGLTDEEIEDIIHDSDLTKHFEKVSCLKNPRHPGCESYKCKSQLFEIKEGDKVSYKCADCPYPEVVYTDVDGERRYTPNLIFAKDMMKLIEADGKNNKCNTCGRFFSEEYLKKSKCPLCSTVVYAYKGSGDKVLYKKYKNLLPLGARLMSVFATKTCAEDDELVMFKLGSHVYAFNKLNVKEKGLIKGPKKLY